ncbi:MAG: hypothetical protein IBJ00_04335 [Alphaproteobacteria bacterium]|nr:hypothetical protein [Alphaproteobacteria bacterium]
MMLYSLKIRYSLAFYLTLLTPTSTFATTAADYAQGVLDHTICLDLTTNEANAIYQTGVHDTWTLASPPPVQPFSVVNITKTRNTPTTLGVCQYFVDVVEVASPELPRVLAIH